MPRNRGLAYASMVAVLLGMAELATGCCHCRSAPPPPPCAEFRECRHPKLAEVDSCLKDCGSAPPAAKAVCQRTCCGLVNDLSQATAEEKDALRRCRADCQ
jgi:hypothetical protein